jgi:hypothetical protein
LVIMSCPEIWLQVNPDCSGGFYAVNLYTILGVL